MASPIDTSTRALVATLAAAAGTALIAVPLTSLAAGLFIAALLLLPAVAAAGLFAAACRSWPRSLRRPWVGDWLFLGHCGGYVLLGGVYVTNLLIVDAPFGYWARCGYALAGVATAVIVMVARRQARLRAALVAAGTARVVGGLLLADALAAGLLDNYGIRSEYPVHGILLMATLVGLVAGTQLLLPRQLGRRTGAVALAGLVAIVAGASALRRAPLYALILSGQSSQVRVLLAARALTDRDHDGFSAWFGGGDCNDANPNAYPLSPVRDCLGWRDGEVAAARRLPKVTEVSSKAPHVILLVTMDAFRCGFDRGGPPLLHDDCPALTRLAAQGWSRLDAHVTVPITEPSMTVLMTGDPNAKPLPFRTARPTLPGRLHEAGYSTEVLETFDEIVGDETVATAFDHIDTSLRSIVSSPFRGERLTDLTVARVTAALHRPGRAFIWAHYPDAHFPYVVDDGSPRKRTTLADYANVVRRTDAAVGRLAAALSRLPGAADMLVVITADHGEEFGEHGQRYHGFTLFENAVRVPIIVWSPVEHRRFYHLAPPPTLAGLARYILTAIGTTEPPVAPALATRGMPILLRTPVDHQLGVIANGYKLIYDRARNTVKLFELADDPGERHDLHAADPGKVRQVGRILSSLMGSCPRRARMRRVSRPQG